MGKLNKCELCGEEIQERGGKLTMTLHYRRCHPEIDFELRRVNKHSSYGCKICGAGTPSLNGRTGIVEHYRRLHLDKFIPLPPPSLISPQELHTQTNGANPLLNFIDSLNQLMAENKSLKLKNTELENKLRTELEKRVQLQNILSRPD